ncbi:MAG: WHG domain-containing protein [Polyangiaceae bacterium]
MTKPKEAKSKPAYHHGDLRAALLRAGEAVLRRDGVVGLGVRAVTREAGVSHTAAKPHFGNLDALRAEIAALGYERLAEALTQAQQVRPLRAMRVALARSYVHFAYDNPALFELMFRHQLVDMTHPALVAATARAIRAIAGDTSSESLGREDAIRITAGWAYVHGLAVLLIEKRLRGVQKDLPSFALYWSSRTQFSKVWP